MGVSLPTIDTWRKEGMPVKVHGSKGVEWVFELDECIKWRVSRAAESASAGATSDISEIERRTAAAKMAKAELELAKAKGEVAPIRDFERAQAKAFAEIQQNIMNVPQRVVTQLLGETDEIRFKQVLRSELVLALESAANADLTLTDDADEDEDDQQ